MSELFADFPEAITNTQRIADSCDVRMNFDRIRLPEVETPDGSEPQNYLERLCREGLARRRSGAPKRYDDRLEYELEVIQHTQFANYFLVVWDILAYARKEGILFGVGAVQLQVSSFIAWVLRTLIRLNTTWYLNDF